MCSTSVRKETTNPPISSTITLQIGWLQCSRKLLTENKFWLRRLNLNRRIPIDDLLVCIQTFEGTFDNASSGIKEFGTAVGTPQEGGFSQGPVCVYILISYLILHFK